MEAGNIITKEHIYMLNIQVIVAFKNVIQTIKPVLGDTRIKNTPLIKFQLLLYFITLA